MVLPTPGKKARNAIPNVSYFHKKIVRYKISLLTSANIFSSFAIMQSPTLTLLVKSSWMKLFRMTTSVTYIQAI